MTADEEDNTTNDQEQHSDFVDLNRPSILTFLYSISQEGVVEDKDAMQLPTSIKVTEGKLWVSFTLAYKVIE